MIISSKKLPKLVINIGIKFSPKATKGLTKKLNIAIPVVGRPMPITPFIVPAIKYVKSH